MCLQWIVKLLSTQRLMLFVLFFELFQKFSTFGFQSVLFLFLKHEQQYTLHNSIGIYHMYVGTSYLVPMIGTIIADLYMNKVLTILLISFFGVLGQVIVVLAAIAYSGEEFHVLPVVMDNIRFLSGFGLLLRAMGVGGFREVASSLEERDPQFAMDPLIHNMFHQLLHYAICIGMTLAFIIPPVLRMNVSCFGNYHCFPLALGIPGVATVLVALILMGGYRHINYRPSGQSLTVDTYACITAALFNFCAGGAHWLDNASYAFHDEFLDEVKLALHVLALYLPLPIFWALFEQMGSRWVMQATTMETTLNAERNWYIEPEQMMAFNPLILLVLLPIAEVIICPLWTRARFGGVKMRMVIGAVMAVAAFLWAGYVEYRNEAFLVKPPEPGIGHIYLFNPMYIPIDYTLEFPGEPEIVRRVFQNSMDIVTLPVKGTRPFNVSIYIVYGTCTSFRHSKIPPQPHFLAEGHYVSVTMSPFGNIPMPVGSAPCYVPEGLHLDARYSTPKRCELQLARVGISYFTRRVHGIDMSNDHRFINMTITMKRLSDGLRVSKYCGPNHSGVDYFDVRPGLYKMFTGGRLFQCRFRRGATYMIIYENDGKGVCKTLVAPHKSNVTIWWQVPQYVLITVGQYLYPLTLLEYSLTQTRVIMKPVLWNTWLMSIALGNYLVAIFTFPNMFTRELWYYVLFTFLMAVDCVFLFILLFNYTPVDVIEESRSESRSGSSSESSSGSSSESSSDSRSESRSGSRSGTRSESKTVSFFLPKLESRSESNSESIMGPEETKA